MGRFIIQVAINAFALWVASWILPGLNIAPSSILGEGVGGSEGAAETFNTILAYLFIGLIFGIVNAL